MTKLLLVGAAGFPTIAPYFMRGATELGIQARFQGYDYAYSSGLLYRKVAYRLFGDLPLLGIPFNHHLKSTISKHRPDLLIATGKAPVFASTVDYGKKLGCKSINYSTDDPWSRTQKARWFHRALRSYHGIATPRAANIEQCEQMTPRVAHIPFGYDPTTHFWEDRKERLEQGEVFFAGGCDADRAPFFEALVDSGIKPLLYGGYWNRRPKLKPFHGGFIDFEGQRRLYAEVPISVCLVRHSNRDGHVMRTYEAPAMGACLAMEDTPEHRAVFGEDGDKVVYFTTPESLVVACKRLLADPNLRRRLRENAHQAITTGGHTYRHRLEHIVRLSQKN